MKRILFALMALALATSVFGEANYHQKATGPIGGKMEVVNDKIKKVNIGAGFALRFQSLHHKNNGTTNSGTPLKPINSGFTNAKGNLSFDFQLSEGMNAFIETYLSSEHHTDVYMKEGYMFIDNFKGTNLEFLNPLMGVLSFKVGQMEINYGDYHFRRSNNGRVGNNPFIGNYIIDSNPDEIGIEALLDFNKVEFLFGYSSGTTKGDISPSHGYGKYGKLAYDEKITSDMRFRASGTYYMADHSKNGITSTTGTTNYLYSGNRAGSPFAGIFNSTYDGGAITPSTTKDVKAMMLNVLFQIKGFEVFLNYDTVRDDDYLGNTDTAKLKEEWAQYAADVKYDINKTFYVAGRYNQVSHKKKAGATSNEKVSRYTFDVGCHITDTALMKIEYVSSKYTNFSNANDLRNGGKYDGFLLEGSVDF